MPLLKLWNSIRGRSAPKQSPAELQSPAEGPSEARSTAGPAAIPKASRGTGFNIFRGGPHAGLCKLLKSVTACSVLEISVEDGSRAIAVLERLAKTRENVRYVAIDPFEMGSGGVTLRQFHQTLRAKNIRPQLFPGTIDRGLLRVAHTIGSVDLVLIAAPVQSWQSPQVLPLLSRVSHAKTVILYLDGETWKPYQFAPASLQRAA